MLTRPHVFCSFFFHVPATTEIYTLSLHDALPICVRARTDLARLSPSVPAAVGRRPLQAAESVPAQEQIQPLAGDRKSTRLNSSHSSISYAVFCLKKKR